MSSSSLKAIAAVIFDWAGTTVDHGSLAPVRTLQQVFAKRGIALAGEVARRDMGLAKRDHIRLLLREPEVAIRWEEIYRRQGAESDVDELYQDFVPLQLACLLDHAKVIEGVVPVVDRLRSNGVRIGGTTGYTRAMLDELQRAACAQGYAPDQSLCPEDVGTGRPHPFMCYQLAVNLKAAPLSACVKVGDTFSDIEEGRNAGMWTVGVLRTGNLIGLSEQDWCALPDQEKSAAIRNAGKAMREHGAHFIVEAVGEILPALEEIAGRVERGECPCS
ncbi:MAG: phosphonoacetaldehyde hydrolase [Acidobacteria bacterium]|nr:phosphonoacetaldehyde hydrolase [Acidobacteriota bacterium]